MNSALVNNAHNEQQHTTLERSLASLNGDANCAATKKKRNNHKKRNNKKTNGTASSIDFADEVEDGWMPVVSKKSKTKEAAPIPAVPVAEPVTNVVEEQQSSASSDVAQKKRRRRTDKSKSKQTPPLSTATTVGAALEPAPFVAPKAVPNTPIDGAPPRGNLQKDTAPPPPPTPSTSQRTRRKSNSAKSDIKHPQPSQQNQPGALSYAHELEYLVSEVLGEDAVAKARAAFPSLIFSRPPPIADSATRSDPSKVCYLSHLTTILSAIINLTMLI